MSRRNTILVSIREFDFIAMSSWYSSSSPTPAQAPTPMEITFYVPVSTAKVCSVLVCFVSVSCPAGTAAMVQELLSIVAYVIQSNLMN